MTRRNKITFRIMITIRIKMLTVRIRMRLRITTIATPKVRTAIMNSSSIEQSVRAQNNNNECTESRTIISARLPSNLAILPHFGGRFKSASNLAWSKRVT